MLKYYSVYHTNILRKGSKAGGRWNISSTSVGINLCWSVISYLLHSAFAEQIVRKSEGKNISAAWRTRETGADTNRCLLLPSAHATKHLSAEIFLSTIHLSCTSTFPCFMYAWCINRCPLTLMNHRVFLSLKKIHDPSVRFTEVRVTQDNKQEQEMAVKACGVEMLLFGCDFVTLTCVMKSNQKSAKKVSSQWRGLSRKRFSKKTKQKQNGVSRRLAVMWTKKTSLLLTAYLVFHKWKVIYSDKCV